jgi:transcription-repair coupling factor (superfamily II helicase)
MPERLNLYSDLAKVNSEKELADFQEHLIDRFGPYPKEVTTLLASVRLKWMGKALGFERIALEKSIMKLYFPSDEKSPLYDSLAFMKLLQYIAAHSGKFEMKQTSKTVILTIKSVQSITQATDMLQTIEGIYGE